MYGRWAKTDYGKRGLILNCVTEKIYSSKQGRNEYEINKRSIIAAREVTTIFRSNEYVTTYDKEHIS